MGEENKGGEGEMKKETTQEEERGGDEIVLKVDMHCEACAKKVVRALITFPGVEEVAVNRSVNTVVVKGKTADPAKLCERIRKKSGRKVQLLSPLPDLQEKKGKLLISEDKGPHNDGTGINKDQPPPVKTVVLRVQMHCEACAHLLRKRIRKMTGVESVETDVGKDQVTVKGVIADPATLAKYVYKRTRKQTAIIAVNDDDHDQTKKSGDAAADDDEKKKLQDDGKPGEIEQEDNEKRISQVMSRYYDYYYWPPTAMPSYSHMEYNSFNYQQPNVFNDDNPNACSIM